MADPNHTCAAFTAMPPYSELVVHGDGPAYDDARNVPHGTVTRHGYHSAVTQSERELYVYTPPGFDRTKTYPVLCLIGGSGELPSNWIHDGRAGFIMDNLLAQRKAVPMVVVMPYGNMMSGTPDPTTLQAAEMYKAFTDDFLYRQAVTFDEHLKEKKIEHQSFVTDGGHTWMNARHSLTETSQLYFK